MGPKIFASNWSKWTLSFIAIRNLRKQPSNVVKLAWYIIIIGTAVAFLVHVGFLIAQYVQFNSSANLKYFYLPKMHFPATTVCSINPFKQTKIGSSVELTQFMEAYNFILGERQKLLRSNRTGQSYNSSQLYQSDNSLSDFNLSGRKKRQTCTTEIKQNQYNNSVFYSELYCNNKTVLNFYCVDNSTALSLNLSYALTTQTRKIMDASFYYCLSRYTVCGGQNACTTYSDTMSLLKSVNACLTTQGLIADLAYPPDFWTGNPANDMSRRIGSLCSNYANPYFTYAYFEKPTNNFPGVYSYTSGTYNGYGHINATIDNCDRSGTYYVAAEIPSNCTNNYINIVTNLVDCMSNYSCGHACVYGACPYTETPIDQCGNSAYYDTLCAIAVCNATSSTEYSTSTTQLSTELTSTSTELSTTSFMSTEMTSTPLESSTSTEILTSTESSTSSSSTSTTTSTPSTTLISTTQSTSTLSTTSALLTSSSILTTTPSTTTPVTSTDSSTSTTLPTSLSTSSTSSSATSSLATSTLATTTSSMQPSTSIPASLSTTQLLTSTSMLTSTQAQTTLSTTSTLVSSSLATTTLLTSSSSQQTSTTSKLPTSRLTTEIETTEMETSTTSEFETEDTTQSTHPIESSSQSVVSTTSIGETSSLSTLQPLSTILSSTSSSLTTPQQTQSPGLSSSSILSTTTNFPDSTSKSSQTSVSTTPIISTSSTPLISTQTTSKPLTSSTKQSTPSSTKQSTSQLSTLSAPKSSTHPTSQLSTLSTPKSSIKSTNRLSTQSSVKSSIKSSVASTQSKSTPLTTSLSSLTTKSPINQTKWTSSSYKTTSKVDTTRDVSTNMTTKCCNQTSPSISTKSDFTGTTSGTALTTMKSTALTKTTQKPSNITTSQPIVTTSQPLTPREIANLWGLSEYQNQPSFIAHVRQSLIEIAASLTPEEREELCYSLPELVSSCNMGEEPCDMDNDFAQVFDVNYGYCYTYNPQLPFGIHDSIRTGPNYGLRMVLFTNPVTYLNSTESKGFKIVVHSQDYTPFPNTEGYFGDVGKSIDLILSEDRYTRLSQPYGHCDTSETLKERGQPFFFNGSYSIEGCFRSCFQQKIVDACQCADPRFPYTEQGMFCIQTNASNYECNQDYIAKNGDYYFTNCTCYNPCNETDFTAQLWHSNWPSGGFFYEQYCPSAEMSGLDCEQYYRNNSAEIFVYYSRLTYSTLDEVASTQFVDLLADIGGSSGLWIGCTAVTIGELMLLLIQSILWCLCCRFELCEVPSCRRNDYSMDESRGSWDGNDPSGLKHDAHPALPFRNSVTDMGNTLNNDDIVPEFQLIFKQMIPVRDGDHVPPMPVRSSPSPVPPLIGE